ncbi:MAG: hypothetical protein KGL39_16520 [Patescibacteria group bacterium]|nr:hypothetical protein [Patescibacteria group bacterium]
MDKETQAWMENNRAFHRALARPLRVRMDIPYDGGGWNTSDAPKVRARIQKAIVENQLTFDDLLLALQILRIDDGEEVWSVERYVEDTEAGELRDKFLEALHLFNEGV